MPVEVIASFPLLSILLSITLGTVKQLRKHIYNAEPNSSNSKGAFYLIPDSPFGNQGLNGTFSGAQLMFFFHLFSRLIIWNNKALKGCFKVISHFKRVPNTQWMVPLGWGLGPQICNQERSKGTVPSGSSVCSEAESRRSPLMSVEWEVRTPSYNQAKGRITPSFHFSLLRFATFHSSSIPNPQGSQYGWNLKVASAQCTPCPVHWESCGAPQESQPPSGAERRIAIDLAFPSFDFKDHK